MGGAHIGFHVCATRENGVGAALVAAQGAHEGRPYKIATPHYIPTTSRTVFTMRSASGR
jgi:hypothetical protein